MPFTRHWVFVVGPVQLLAQLLVTAPDGFHEAAAVVQRRYDAAVGHDHPGIHSEDIVKSGFDDESRGVLSVANRFMFDWLVELP